ncbi:MAG: LysM peptidoglycan-binding domain-containing protein [Rhodobacteraceae bacterium]|nr:LysM peptidoglycan-binding domain-containing protein [Paracoccaceae bacterium]
MRHSLSLMALVIFSNLVAGPSVARWEMVLDNQPAQETTGSTDQLQANRTRTHVVSPGKVEQSECRHLVQPGETLSGIALSRLGDTARWREIASFNQLPSDGRINHGTVLNLPCKGNGDGEYRNPKPPQEDTRDLATAISDTRKEMQSLPVIGKAGSKGQIITPDMVSPVGAGKSLEQPEDLDPAKPKDQATQTFPPEGAGPIPPDFSNSETVQDDEGIPVWKASGGALLDEVIANWTLGAGYRLIIRDRWSWKLDYDYQFEGDLKDAIEDLLSGYSYTSPTPIVTFYTNNVVVLSFR